MRKKERKEEHTTVAVCEGRGRRRVTDAHIGSERVVPWGKQASRNEISKWPARERRRQCDIIQAGIEMCVCVQ